MNGHSNVRAVVAIEGQIGAGKTTLGTFLSEALGIPLYRELSNPHTRLLLDRFYADMDRWSFTAQTHFLVLRAGQSARIDDEGCGVLDRSIYGDRLFADVLYNDGHMCEEEYRTYSDLYEQVVARVTPPDLMIYLDCDTPTALERIRKRNRKSEAHISAEYLDRLHERYAEWFSAYQASRRMYVPADDETLVTESGRAKLLDQLLAILGISAGSK